MEETIIFGGGCFWCMEAVFQILKGVKSVDSGFSGGNKINPTYQEVSSGETGHAEVVKIIFDSSLISLEELLEVFFTTHDPTTFNQQGSDIGHQYRSAIFYTTEEQKNVVDEYVRKLTENKAFEKPILTEIRPFEMFYIADESHKNYYKAHPEEAYCKVNINPKIAKLRQKHAGLLR